jgi:metal-responsive CopG/Arc/MetJ family transcriptional regulator
MSKSTSKISVVLTDGEFRRFEEYCRERGFKKSTLIARLIRNYLDSEHFLVLGEDRCRHG